jgi:TRAP-type mannitol/chloroaromatic compound transport system permease large subunit
MKGAIPFLITDGIVLLLMLFFPVLCLWLPDLLIVSHFK